MRFKLALLGVLVLVIFIVALFATNDDNITTGSVAGVAKCVGPTEAITLINEHNCERIYKDSKCAEKGLVEVLCK